MKVKDITIEIIVSKCKTHDCENCPIHRTKFCSILPNAMQEEDLEKEWEELEDESDND